MYQQFKDNLAELINQNKDGADYSPFIMEKCWDTIASIAKKHPEYAWDVFRNGTNDEFIALIPGIDEYGKALNTDEANKEIMSLAKRRGTPDVIDATRNGFGVLFDKYYNSVPAQPPEIKTARVTPAPYAHPQGVQQSVGGA